MSMRWLFPGQATDTIARGSKAVRPDPRIAAVGSTPTDAPSSGGTQFPSQYQPLKF